MKKKISCISSISIYKSFEDALNEDRNLTSKDKTICPYCDKIIPGFLDKYMIHKEEPLHKKIAKYMKNEEKYRSTKIEIHKDVNTFYNCTFGKFTYNIAKTIKIRKITKEEKLKNFIVNEFEKEKSIDTMLKIFSIGFLNLNNLMYDKEIGFFYSPLDEDYRYFIYMNQQLDKIIKIIRRFFTDCYKNNYIKFAFEKATKDIEPNTMKYINYCEKYLDYLHISMPLNENTVPKELNTLWKSKYSKEKSMELYNNFPEMLLSTLKNRLGEVVMIF